MVPYPSLHEAPASQTHRPSTAKVQPGARLFLIHLAGWLLLGCTNLLAKDPRASPTYLLDATLPWDGAEARKKVP